MCTKGNDRKSGILAGIFPRTAAPAISYIVMSGTAVLEEFGKYGWS
jgi:hypothetical protein